jgi:hypothetical protein
LHHHFARWAYSSQPLSRNQQLDRMHAPVRTLDKELFWNNKLAGLRLDTTAKQSILSCNPDSQLTRRVLQLECDQLQTPSPRFHELHDVIYREIASDAPRSGAF